MAHILVAYASKHGSTAEIAGRIGEVLLARGNEVTVAPARSITSLDGYDAVVLGSALYSAHWQRDANRFVRRYLHQLQDRPVWLFSSGPLDHSADFADIPLSPHVEPEVAPIGARGHRTFGGRLLVDTPGITPEMAATHRVGDYRNWDLIGAWAGAIAEALTAG